jgi:hypothetical protein
MRRLAARRGGGPSDREPSPRRPSVAMLAAGLVAVLLLVVAAVAWWPEDRSTAPPAGSSAPRATRPPTDPATLQRQLDGGVEAGTPGVVGLVRMGERTWRGASGLGDLRARRPARARDRFRIGSVTKSFVATLEGYQTTAFSTPDADRQLVMATDLNPEPEPGAATAAVENILRREVSC